jgi:murein L,D-transpeptidase YcbB/YkuD
VYLTAFVRDGSVAFRDDIYDRDNGLIRALGRGARVPPALAKVVMTTILAGDTR